MIIDYKKKYLYYKKKYLYLNEENNKLNILDSTKKKLNIRIYNYITNKEDLLWKDNIIIIGNGDIPKNKQNDIDKFNMVIRVNAKAHNNNEDYNLNSGKKTDLFVWAGTNKSVNEMIKNNKFKQHLSYHTKVSDEINKLTKNSYILDIKCITCYNYITCGSFFKDNDIKIGNIKKIKDGKGNMQQGFFSTGLRTILWSLILGFQDITITGFTLNDKYTEFKNDKYYRKSIYTKDITEYGCCHDLFEEYRLLQQLIDKKLIKVLK